MKCGMGSLGNGYDISLGLILSLRLVSLNQQQSMMAKMVKMDCVDVHSSDKSLRCSVRKFLSQESLYIIILNYRSGVMGLKAYYMIQVSGEYYHSWYSWSYGVDVESKRVWCLYLSWVCLKWWDQERARRSMV